MTTYTIRHNGKYSYVCRPLTPAETWRYIGNGYVPPTLEREAVWEIHRYLRGYEPPHYPVPALYQPGLEREADGTCYHAMTDCRDPIYVAWFNSI